MLQDVILATVGDIDVSLLFPDGSTVEVTQDTISKSQVLREIIPTTSADDKVLLTAPKGVVVNWLQSMAAIKSDFAYTRPAAPWSGEDSDAQLTAFLKVMFLLSTVFKPSSRFERRL